MVYSMRKRRFILCLLLTIVVVFPGAYGSVWDPYHTKEEKIEMWKTLWDSHPNTHYESVGKTYEDRDIWIFTAGNPNGGKVLWDGEIHGGEDSGSEIMYMIASWLLESGEPEAKQILERNHLLFVPIINVDSYTRGTMNRDECYYGVDLNRNFETGWRSTPCREALDYSGEYPASEPETRAMRNVFRTYRPDFYVNLHCGTGPVLFYNRDGNVTLAHEVIDRIAEISYEMGVAPYRTSGIDPTGFAISDANSFGASAWLIEVVGEDSCWRHTDELFQELVDVYYPKCLAIFITMCEFCARESPSALFEDGFESGDFGQWTGTTVSSGESATVASTLPHHGTYHGSFTTNGGNSWESAYSYIDIDEDEVYARGYFYVDDGLPLVDDDDRFYFLRFPAQGVSLTGAGVRRSDGVDKWVMYARDGEGWAGPVYATSPAIEAGRWYCVELHWKEHSSQGLVEMYVDGERVLEMENIDTSYYGNADEIDFGAISVTHVQDGLVVYGDCFEASNGYIGLEPA